MNVLAKIFGVLLVLGGIVAGVYYDFVVLFVGGIIEVINGVKVNPTNTDDVVWGIVKATMLTGVGLIAGAIVVIIGLVLCGVDVKRKKKLRRRY